MSSAATAAARAIVAIAGAWRAAQRVAVLLLLSPLLAACLEFETTVRVEPDGSGTITERFLMGHQIVEMLTGMVPEGETFEILDEEQLRADVANYGESVRFVSAEPLETEFGKGYLARYGFDDINSLRLDTDPGAKIPEEEGMEAAPEGEGAAPETDYVTFSLDGSDPARLVIRWPVQEADGEAEPAEGEEAPTAQGEPDPGELEMIKGLFKGMRMAMHVEVAGEIVETNATHRDGATVTLLDVAFGELLSNEAALKLMAMEDSGSLAEFKELSQDVPGLKIELEPEVAISFR